MNCRSCSWKGLGSNSVDTSAPASTAAAVMPTPATACRASARRRREPWIGYRAASANTRGASAAHAYHWIIDQRR